MLKNNDISIPEACYADLCKVVFFERKQVKLTIIWNEKISRNKQILTLKSKRQILRLLLNLTPLL